MRRVCHVLAEVLAQEGSWPRGYCWPVPWQRHSQDTNMDMTSAAAAWTGLGQSSVCLERVTHALSLAFHWEPPSRFIVGAMLLVIAASAVATQWAVSASRTDSDRWRKTAG